jgi:hypothetical protein
MYKQIRPSTNCFIRVFNVLTRGTNTTFTNLHEVQKIRSLQNGNFPAAANYALNPLNNSVRLHFYKLQSLSLFWYSYVT